jgi:hypothetical protein
VFDLPSPVKRLAGAAILGFALAAAPAITALSGAQAQSVAEPACVGSESVVDGTPTCVPAPTAPEASDPQTGPVDSQQHDGGHH